MEWSIKNPLQGYLLARYEESMAQLSRNILILDDCAKYYIIVVELNHFLQPTKKAQWGEKFEKNLIQCDVTATTICLSGVDKSRKEMRYILPPLLFACVLRRHSICLFVCLSAYLSSNGGDSSTISWSQIRQTQGILQSRCRTQLSSASGMSRQ